MIAAVDVFGRNEQNYHADLVREAENDVVFVMNIKVGADNFRCKGEEEPLFVERAICYLLEHGAVVGDGDPDEPNWTIRGEFIGPPAEVAKRIVNSWAEDRLALDALVFAIRGHRHVA